jgi:hypothetical protein
LAQISSVPAAWPTAVEAKIIDNGEPALSLLPLGDGRWSRTWASRTAITPSLKVTINAASADLELQGSASVGGAITDNPGVPIVSAGGGVNVEALQPQRALRQVS